MQPYERIVSAVEHRRGDRPAIDYQATPEFDDAIKGHLGIKDKEELLDYLGVDIRRVSGRYVGPGDTTGAPGVTEAGRDYWGVVWKPMVNKFGTYNEIAYCPLGEATTVAEIEEYSWPSVDWFDFSHLKDEIDRINDKRGYAIQFFAGGAFESPWYMRGLERFLLDLAQCPDIAECISSHVSSFYKERAMRAIEASEGRLDIIGSGGDLGTQRGMMLSPDLWRKHVKPYSSELITTFKDMGFITYYHSCGGILPVIEDFIEMGLDILDPIQPKAAGMDAETLAAKFGGRITFHGGVDEQELLPNGSVEDVQRETRRLIEILGRDGGYIVCPAHALQPDTPVENALAMYEAAKEMR